MLHMHFVWFFNGIIKNSFQFQKKQNASLKRCRITQCCKIFCTTQLKNDASFVSMKNVLIKFDHSCKKSYMILKKLKIFKSKPIFQIFLILTIIFAYMTLPFFVLVIYWSDNNYLQSVDGCFNGEVMHLARDINLKHELSKNASRYFYVIIYFLFNFFFGWCRMF